MYVFTNKGMRSHNRVIPRFCPGFVKKCDWQSIYFIQITVVTILQLNRLLITSSSSRLISDLRKFSSEIYNSLLKHHWILNSDTLVFESIV